MKLNIHLLLCSKRHYIDEIEHPPSPICGEKPQFESNVTSFQFRQNASAFWRGLVIRRNLLHYSLKSKMQRSEKKIPKPVWAKPAS